MISVQTNYLRQRRRLADKQENDRLLRISFHTFRHFFAYKFCERDPDIPRLRQALGHKNINNTMVYTYLTDFKPDECDVKIVRTAEEAKTLLLSGYDRVDTFGDEHLYRRRK